MTIKTKRFFLNLEKNTVGPPIEINVAIFHTDFSGLCGRKINFFSNIFIKKFFFKAKIFIFKIWFILEP